MSSRVATLSSRSASMELLTPKHGPSAANVPDALTSSALEWSTQLKGSGRDGPAAASDHRRVRQDADRESQASSNTRKRAPNRGSNARSRGSCKNAAAPAAAAAAAANSGHGTKTVSQGHAGISLMRRSESERHQEPGQEAESSTAAQRRLQAAQVPTRGQEGEQESVRRSAEHGRPAGVAAGIIQLPEDARAGMDRKGHQPPPRRSEGNRPAKTALGPPTSQSQRPTHPLERNERGADHRQPRHESRHSEGHPQLFDPKRHNALSFARGLSVTSNSDTRSSHAPSTVLSSARSVTSSEGRERRRRRGGQIAGSEASSRSSRVGDDTCSQSDSKSACRSTAEPNGFVSDLKSVYREISKLEDRLKNDHQSLRQSIKEEPRGRQQPRGRSPDGSLDHAFWLSLVEQHKALIELYNQLLDMASQPNMPASVRALPEDYQIAVRLWQNGCHLLLESMRQSLPQINDRIRAGASLSHHEKAVQAGLLDLLTDFIYAAYTAYSNLLEAEHLRAFRACWLESLGDLARYRMLMAGLAAAAGSSPPGGTIRNKARRESRWTDAGSHSAHSNRVDESDTASQDLLDPQERPLDQASVGSAALGDWDLEEKETWRMTAKGWYSKGLSETPGNGRLQHHLAVLSQGDDLRTLHHFCKSLTTTQPFNTGRESMLPLFDPANQSRRVAEGASTVDLFVHLHGMLFTRIELDNFDVVLSRYLSQLTARLETLGWERAFGLSTLAMMASVNIAALVQYGVEGAVLQLPCEGPSIPKRAASEAVPSRQGVESSTTLAVHGAGGRSPGAGSPSRPMPDDGGKRIQEPLPVALRCALRLAFDNLTALMGVSTKSQPSHRSNPDPDPYTTMLLTFLFRLAKAPPTELSHVTLLSRLTEFVPWSALAELAASAQGKASVVMGPQKISSSCPLPEDWCLRGLSWTGRRLFERDYWKAPLDNGQRCKSETSSQAELGAIESEVDVLNLAQLHESLEATDVLESASSLPQHSASSVALQGMRWERVALALGALTAVVPGFDRVEHDTGLVTIEICSPLADKLKQALVPDNSAKQPLESRSSNDHEAGGDDGFESNDSSTAFSSEDEGDASAQCEEDDDDPPNVQALKARRRQLLSTLRRAQSSTRATDPSDQSAPTRRRPVRDDSSATIKPPRPRPASAVAGALPGYTVLVLDTNILLAESGRLAQDLVDSKMWTVVVPLAVVTELDGLKHNSDSKVATGAVVALSFLESAVKSHARWLKVQTSKGNYLSDLKIRTEEIDFGTSLTPRGKPATSTKHDTRLEAGGEGKNPAPSAEHHRARTLDEVILRCLTWQMEHFTDRLPLLAADPSKERAKITAATPKVILVTLDRSLRLKTRAKGCVAAGAPELADLVLLATPSQGVSDEAAAGKRSLKHEAVESRV